MPPKKYSRRPKLKKQPGTLKKRSATPKKSNESLGTLRRELRAALEQQTATSEILRVISSSPTDLQPVFETIVANATRLCGTHNAGLYRFDGEFLNFVAGHNLPPEIRARAENNPIRPGRETATRRAALERRTIHVADVLAAADFDAYQTEANRREGRRSTLAVPLLKENTLLGVITTSHYFEVRPFTDNQIALVKTFADQAVIAIENVRLFQELTEALEQQTATSEILGVIASSPTEIQPVLNTVATNAARLCDATDAQIRLVEGDGTRLVASFGTLPAPEFRPTSPGTPTGQAILNRETIHIHDISTPEAQAEFSASSAFLESIGVRTALVTPLLREGVAIGAILIRRTEVHPFSDKQIKLLETFADQAVIAIENVRLFQELQARNRDLTEALEQQTATSEILRVIASSPTEIQPVLDAVIANAVRLAGAKQGHIRQYDGEMLQLVASYGETPEQIAILRASTAKPSRESSGSGRAFLEGRVVHVHDVQSTDRPAPQAVFAGARTLLAVPLLREGTPTGVITIWRDVVEPFTERQIDLVKTFADQAVIAIENVRLFQELQSRNRDLTEALEQQTATSEILRVISSSPTDVQPVFQTILANAVRLCEAQNGAVFRFDGEVFRAVVWNNISPALQAYIENTPIRPGRESSVRRVGLEKRAVHIPDILADPECIVPEPYREEGMRTNLAVPLLKENNLIGAIAIHRREVRPFTDAHIKLVSTFADQAVIAIENVRLFQELQLRNRDLTEALEQQTATSEILRVIASSPTDIQPVLDTVAESAARLCDAPSAVIHRVDGNILRRVAASGEFPTGLIGEEVAIDRSKLSGRAVVDRQTIHIHDMAAAVETEFPGDKHIQQVGGTRSVLATPLLREGIPIGVTIIRRREVRPFTDKQIQLLKTFADQAVIAIENVRLFRELEERNAELREALEHQTATAEVLGIISRSPTDVQPVLDAIVESAARVCGIDDVVLRLREGNTMVSRAHFGPIPIPIGRVEVSIDAPQWRWMREHGTLHIPDARAQNDFPMFGSVGGWRTFLSVPLRQQGKLIGGLNARRTEVRPFTPAQIKLLETFADQAVIAIENVRLFKELEDRNRQITEALEQQTATSQILGVIASSPTDIQPVLDTVAANAARLCEATDAQIRLVEGDGTRLVASFGSRPAPEFMPTSPGNPAGLAILQRQTVHVHDLRAAVEFRESEQITSRYGTRTFLSTPMLREGTPIGVINIRRTEVRPFSERQIKLLETFAAQAVIAIENVRLFQELEARTRELARSVGELKALGDVGQAVSSTLDLQTVLSTIVGHAVQLSGASGGVVYEYDEAKQEFHLRASHRMEKEVVEALQITPVRPGEGATGRTVSARAPVQVVDLLDERGTGATRVRPIMARLGYRSLLAVPLLREERIMGALTVWRKEAGSFSTEVVNLLQTFATQSVLAIQNARLFREIEDKSRQLEIANRHKSEFLANMSHELRTPLNAIIGFSEVLGERMFGELNEKQAEYTEDILSSGRHLLSLINDILDLSKVEAGRMELELTKFDLPMAIDNALTLIRERATRRGIRLHHSVDDRLGDLVGDERKIKQILLNLLSNAVKFTSEGGRVEVKAMQADGSVEISVSDSGIGIAPEDQETIFEEFRQVGKDYAQKREGTGLGLTLTRKFVEMHGGKIWVESEPGKGATFTFTLPIRQ